MIKNNIDSLIKESMLEKNSTRTEVLRAIKNEFLVYQTAKNAKELDDAAEISILNKMIKQRKESADQYIQGNRPELADKEMAEADIINSFLPVKATIDDMHNEVISIIVKNGWLDDVMGPYIPKKNMGEVIKQVKSKLINVDGKELAKLVKTYV